MKFSDFLEALPESERLTIEAAWEEYRELLTNAGGAHRQFAINLEAECMFCEAAWQSIRVVVLGRITDVSELKIELTRVCRLHALQGERIAPPIPSPLGRAVTKEMFVEVLREQFTFNSDNERDQFMFELLDSSATMASNSTQLRNKLLAKANRIMWATFNLGADGMPTGNNPFDGMPDDADRIRARLGLSTEDKGKDLLLFVYNLPLGMQAHFPTIAEAYAGDSWTWYFRPALESERWGRTMTWDACPDPPLPEIVHKTVACDNLVVKIRVAHGR